MQGSFSLVIGGFVIGLVQSSQLMLDFRGRMAWILLSLPAWVVSWRTSLPAKAQMRVSIPLASASNAALFGVILSMFMIPFMLASSKLCNPDDVVVRLRAG